MIKIPLTEEEKQSLSREASTLDPHWHTYNFRYRGLHNEIINMLAYVEEEHYVRYRMNEVKGDIYECQINIDDISIIPKFPMLKCVGYVGDSLSMFELYSESGSDKASNIQRITSYIGEPIVNASNAINWPLLKTPGTDFRTWYDEPRLGGKVRFNHICAIKQSWNNSKYVYSEDGELYWYNTDTGLKIENGILGKYEGLERKITIPSEVIEIESSAFENNKNLSSVSLGGNTEAIGDNAFAYCTNLRKVSFKRGLKKIGAGAFRDCEKLDELILPDGLKEIGEDAFFRCGINKLKWPSTIDTVPMGTFIECRNLYEVHLPKTLKCIERKAFNKRNIIIIYGQSGSYAEQYAAENGFHFVEE